MSFTKMDFDEYDVIQVKKRADVRDADLRFYYSDRGGSKVANALVISSDVADKWGAIAGDRVDLIASKDRQTYEH